MKRFVVLWLSLLLVLTLVSPASAGMKSLPIPDQAVLEPVAEIPVGTGPTSIQVKPDVEGDAPQGPQSLYAAQDGSIYILDSLQSQVIVWRKGRIDETISLPYTLYPRDILVHQNHLFVLDSNAVVYEASMTGVLLRTHQLPEGMGSLSVYRLAVSAGKVVLWTENYLEIPLDVMPAHLRPSDFAKSNTGRGVKAPDGRRFVGAYNSGGEIVEVDGATKIGVNVYQSFGSVMLTAFDQASNLYAVVEDLANQSPVVLSEVTIRRYDLTGTLTGVAKLPMNEIAAYPLRPIDVTTDGQIYALIPSSTKVTVYRVTLGGSYTSDLSLRAEQVRANLARSAETHAMSTYTNNPYPRATVRVRAKRMTDFPWSWSTKFNTFHGGVARPADALKPVQLTTASQTGIPYTMGGWDSPWSHTDITPWNTFDAALKQWPDNGPLMGNTGDSFYYDGMPGSPCAGTAGANCSTAGIDCSGFVSAAVANYSFSGSKPGTDDLYANSMAVTNAVGSGGGFVSYSGLQPMDMFIRTSTHPHVFMYDSRRLDGTGINTLESTASYANDGGSGFQGAKKYWRRWTDSSSLEGVTGFTYNRTWWAKEYGDDFDKPLTAVGPNAALEGESDFYKFPYTSSVSQTVTVTLTASTGDPDVYVYGPSYSYITKNSAVGGGTVSWTAVPGTTYYVQVYGYSPTTSNYTISKSY